MDIEQKILDLIEDANYVQATAIYEKNKHSVLSSSTSVELARSYHCLSNYEASLKILQRIPLNSYMTIQQKFEGVILELKERFLLDKQIDLSLNKIERIKNTQGFLPVHIEILNELRKIVNCIEPTKTVKQLQQQAEQFTRLFEQQMDAVDTNTLNWEGFPGYVISKGWFQQWKNYVRINERALDRSCPGVISQFEILDHRFHHLQDPSIQKTYTNHLLFDTEQIMVIPARCWDYLSNLYGGVFIERYTILNTSNLIQTQIQLQKIIIRMKGEQKGKSFVQMSRVSFWKDLESKLVRILGNGRVVKQIGNKQYQIQPMKLLENDDFSRMEIIFEKMPHPPSVAVAEIDKCGHCGKTEKLKWCKTCRTVKYCNMECMKNNRKKHQKACKKQQKKAIQLTNLSMKYNLNDLEVIRGKRGLVGLRNLGNTCYINSSIQCLSNTKQFTSFFMSTDFVKQLNVSNVLGSGGEIACYYAKLIRQLWTTDESAVSSWELKRQISKKFTQFSGYSQHDSLEFLGALLDVLHQDTNLIKNKPNTSEKQTNKSDEEASREAYSNYQRRNQSLISNILTSQYKTVLVCPKCTKQLNVFQHFTMLPLPIPQSSEVEINFVRDRHQNQKVNLTIFPQDTVQDLAEGIGRQYGLNAESLRFFKLGDDYTVKEEYKPNTNVQKLLTIEKGDLNACYEIKTSSENSDLFQVHFYYQEDWKDRISYPRFVTIPKDYNDDYIQKVVKNALRIYTQFEIKDSLFKWRIKGHFIEISLIKNIFSRQSSYFSVQQIQLHKEVQSHSLKNCFDLFSKKEVLDEQNKWYCKGCKDHVKANRQISLYFTNKLIIICFKRYSKGRKLKTMIEYPIRNLNIATVSPFSKGVYDLYGVINHYGSLLNGHYTAYCKNFTEDRWYEFNDSKVQPIKQEAVVNSNAYILFYRKQD